MKAMILAAGRGERMRPLTDVTPKPLLKVGRYSLIEHNILALVQAGITEIVVNVAYRAGQIMEALGDGAQYGVHLSYSIEKPGELDTGGGVYKALPLLGQAPFLVINSDTWTDYALKNLSSQPTKLAHLVLVPNPEHNEQGDFGFDAGLVNLRAPKSTFSGIGVYHPDLFRECKLEKFSLIAPLTKAIARRQVTGEIYAGEWVNVGTEEQLAVLNKIH